VVLIHQMAPLYCHTRDPCGFHIEMPFVPHNRAMLDAGFLRAEFLHLLFFTQVSVRTRAADVAQPLFVNHLQMASETSEQQQHSTLRQHSTYHCRSDIFIMCKPVTTALLCYFHCLCCFLSLLGTMSIKSESKNLIC